MEPPSSSGRDPAPALRPRANGPALWSLGMAALTVGALGVSCGLAWLPGVGIPLAASLFPLQLLFATLSLVTGAVGYARGLQGGGGRHTAVVGMGVGMTWFALQALMFALTVGGLATLLALAIALGR